VTPDFSLPIPIFPLPGVVLFPRTVLPLHIFEPRYREMTKDALEGDRLIAMALLKPGWEGQYQGAPPLFGIVGVGSILQDERLGDGRYNLMLQGICRARIGGEIPGRAYRRAILSPIPEPEPPPAERITRLRLALLAVYSSLLKAVGKRESFRIEPDLPLGALCDLLAAFLEAEAVDKQSVLEEIDIERRAGRTIELLRRSSVAATPVKSALKVVEEGIWPPPGSLN